MPDAEAFDTVLVVDFGAQYAQLIARRVREAHVYSEIVPHDMPVAEMLAKRPAGIIFSGGPTSVHVRGRADHRPGGLRHRRAGARHLLRRPARRPAARRRGGPHRQGRVRPHRAGGHRPSPLFEDLPKQQNVWMSHFDSIVAAPPGFKVTAQDGRGARSPRSRTPSAPSTACSSTPRSCTPSGARRCSSTSSTTCAAAGRAGRWRRSSSSRSRPSAPRSGDEQVICGLSGGVDSAVAAALVHKAVGDQLTCVFVDTGMMRAGEADQVEETFRRQFNVHLVHAKAADRFLEQLNDIQDPERKRKIIGETFIRVFEEVASDFQDARFLVQGTLYPDIIESGTKDAAKIKSHHNVGGLPDDMQFELVEPLRNLFKDEVRAVGEQLGLPEEIVWRQPFPGPGLAVRIIGTVTQERLEILRAADAIVTEEIKRAGLYRELWQSFAVLPAVRTVGVMGDERTYAYPIVIRAVTSDDAMTADWARLPYEVLERLSSRIINEVPGVNRVAFDVTSKPPGTIEWE